LYATRLANKTLNTFYSYDFFRLFQNVTDEHII